MTFISRQEAFTCRHCGYDVLPLEHGTLRNHCPKCLFSLHIDKNGPGDRQSDCLSLMEPIAVDQNAKKGFVLIHCCQKCKKVVKNKVAPDDTMDALSSLSQEQWE